MQADDASKAAHPLPAGFERATVKTDADWARVHAFDHAQHVDAPWFDPAKTDQMLAARFRHVTAALDVTWWVARPTAEPRVVAKVGQFVHQGLAWLQEVVTDRDHRRRGLARAMVSAALREAVEVRRVPCCLCADAEDVAAGLYRSLGFDDIGRTLMLWRRPS
jgi:GNAT superfamily N-acetyltransferase